MGRRFPTLSNVIGFIDGCNCFVHAPSAPDEQNEYFNGWLQDTFVSGVFLFATDGTVIWANINFPGDAHIASPLFDKLARLRREGLFEFAIVADTAFPKTGGLKNVIITPLKSGF